MEVDQAVRIKYFIIVNTVKDLHDFSLKDHNTFGINVRCRRFIEFSNIDELCVILCSLDDSDRPLLLLGGGSNLLLTEDFNGTVLHSAIKGYTVKRVDGGILLRCGSGETWDDIVALCVKNGWHGAENLSLIPGEVGASAVQNIGAYGAEVKDIIHKVEAVEVSTGRLVEFENSECEYAYRQSKFKNEWKNRFVITYVTYHLSEEFTPQLGYGNIRAELSSKGITNPTAEQLRNVIIKIRNNKLPDPKVEGNAGSFFMNPVVSRYVYEQLASKYANMPHYIVDNDRVKIPAGWMIEQCGWKGRTLGNAGVHSKQALVLVNKGDATGTDILKLCEAVRTDVKSKFGIEINPEVNIL